MPCVCLVFSECGNLRRGKVALLLGGLTAWRYYLAATRWHNCSHYRSVARSLDGGKSALLIQVSARKIHLIYIGPLPLLPSTRTIDNLTGLSPSRGVVLYCQQSFMFSQEQTYGNMVLVHSIALASLVRPLAGHRHGRRRAIVIQEILGPDDQQVFK
jgi:hypothetical protein